MGGERERQGAVKELEAEIGVFVSIGEAIGARALISIRISVRGMGVELPAGPKAVGVVV